MSPHLKVLVAIAVSFALLMLGLPPWLESWDPLIDIPLVTFVLLLFVIVVSIQWTRGVRAIKVRRKPANEIQVLPFVVPVSNAKEAARKQLEREQVELNRFMTRVIDGHYPIFDAIVAGVILLTNEHCCAVAQNVEQIVPNASAGYFASCNGTSFRIAPGLRYDISAYKGHAVTAEQDAISDRGPIYITDHRVVFAGTARVLTIKLEQIDDVRVYSDGIAVYPENKQDPFVFRFSYGSSILAAAIRAMVDQTLQREAKQRNRHFPREVAMPFSK